MVATSVVVLATTLMVSLTAVFVIAGDASWTSCDRNVPTTTWSEACLNISTTPVTYNLCQETLQHAPDAARVSVYALAAADAAWRSYGATETEAMRRILHPQYDGSTWRLLPRDERAAYERCIFAYAVARGRMAAAMEDAKLCGFRRAAQERGDAAEAVESCADALSGFPQSSLAPMNAADRDLTTVALRLGALIAGDASWSPPTQHLITYSVMLRMNWMVVT